MGNQNSGFYTEYSGAHTHNVTTNASVTGVTGSGQGHTHTLTINNSSSLQPYITVYFFKRTK